MDIHAATAAIVYNVPGVGDEGTAHFRQAVNFGLLYGMGAFRLARDSDLTHAQATHFIEDYFARLPRVKVYLDTAKQLAYDMGYLTTLFGRRRSFPGLHAGSHNIRQQAEREAINMPIQGTAADIIKKAMIELYPKLETLNARMILQVHDELVLEVPEARVQDAAKLVVGRDGRRVRAGCAAAANAAAGDELGRTSKTVQFA